MKFPEFDGDLFDAAEFGDFDWIKTNFEDSSLDDAIKQIQLEVCDSRGETLLTICTYYRHVEIAFFLLDKKRQFKNPIQENRISEYEKVLGRIAHYWRSQNLDLGSNKSIELQHFYHLVFSELWDMGWRGDNLKSNEKLPKHLMPDYFLNQ